MTSKIITLSRSSYDQLLKESNEWFKFGKYISDNLLIKKCQKETSFLMDNAFEQVFADYEVQLNKVEHQQLMIQEREH